MSFTKYIFRQILKISAFYLEKQKSFIPKKKFFLAVSPTYIQKMALAVPIFQKVLVKLAKFSDSIKMNKITLHQIVLYKQNKNIDKYFIHFFEDGTKFKIHFDFWASAICISQVRN